MSEAGQIGAVLAWPSDGSPEAMLMQATEQPSAQPCGRGVCLIGFANSKDVVPWDRPDTDMVGLNELWSWWDETQAARAKAGKPAVPWSHWFEVHPDWAIGATKREGIDNAKHWEWLRQQQPGRPIFMQRKRPEVPASVPFPINELYARFAAKMPALRNRPVYLTSSIGMMLMWAIAQGRDADFRPDGSGQHYNWIGLYGIDLAGDTEYYDQRPNAEFFTGFAAAVGIEVEIPSESAMLRGAFVYAYEEPPGSDGPLSAEFLQKQIATLGAEMAKHNAEVARLETEAAKHRAIVNTLHGAQQAQQSNLNLLTNLVRRGITHSSIVTRAAELNTVDRAS